MDPLDQTPAASPVAPHDAQALAAFICSQLTDREYEVVMLANSERLTYKEVASRLGITISEVRAAVRGSHEVLRLARAIL